MTNRIEEIRKLVDAELKEASDKNGPFNSTHEGWAVIREEFIELTDDIRRLGENLDQLDMCVRHNGYIEEIDPARKLYEYAIAAAAEAIQVAAMAKRYGMDFVKR